MRNRITTVLLAAAGLALAAPGLAQILEVPMRGLGNEWVKQLDLKGRMDWEWIETYPSEVYFATRQDFTRDGDVVTMWTRIEYRDPQAQPVPHRSVASRDAWDCAGQRRANLNIVYYRWSNLDDGEPQASKTMIQSWEGIQPDTLGATLLDFACSLQPLQDLVTGPAAAEPAP